MLNRPKLISPWNQDLSKSLYLDSCLVGKFVCLGSTDDGHIHYALLKMVVPDGVQVRLSIETKTKIVGNCILYSMVNEIGTVIGSFFDCEESKTLGTDLYITIKNSLLTDEELFSYVMSPDEHEPLFKRVADSYSTGCLIYVSSHQDMCIISPTFDEERFKVMELM
jgi:hypothetical protein